MLDPLDDIVDLVFSDLPGAEASNWPGQLPSPSEAGRRRISITQAAREVNCTKKRYREGLALLERDGLLKIEPVPTGPPAQVPVPSRGRHIPFASKDETLLPHPPPPVPL